MPNKYIFLTFDVEEFDMPFEYNHNISSNEQLQVGIDGVNAIKPLLQQSFMQCTLFTTANFAQHFPTPLQQLAQQHEIASHTFYHSNFEVKDLLLSKQTLEKITQQKVVGLRMPRLRKVEIDDVKKAGYLYDSSINPTYLPGRYNNLHLPKTIYNENGLTRVPTAVTPHLRIPLFWLMFKNAPYNLFKFWCTQCLKTYGYVSLYFHPWEFVDLEKYNIPNYTKKPCDQVLLNKLQKLINDFKNEVEFVSIENYLSQAQLLHQ